MQVGTLDDDQFRAVGLDHFNGCVLVDDLLNAVASDQHSVGINDNAPTKPSLVDGLPYSCLVGVRMLAVVVAVLL